MWVWLINSKLGRWLALAFGAVVLFVTLRHQIRVGAQDDMELEQRREDAERIEKGRKAAQNSRETFFGVSGPDIDDELRRRGL
tara:strand:+ start:102 stop:350 length:249 start_codon:yes stop_codon:yes gene_type:complete